MSHQYHDRGAPYGNYDRAQSPRRGPPPPRDYSPDSRQHRPAPLRVPPPRGPPPGPRGPVRPPPPQQQQYGPDSMDRLYDGSAYGGADEFDQWPLPSRPFAPSGRNSPGGSPRGSPRGGPRRPMPQRPQRPDYQDQVLDPPRPTAKIAPADRSYRQPPPPQSYHGSGQWTGEGYRSPQPSHPPPNRTPPQAAHPPPQEFQQPQALQQAVHAQPRNQRAPLGPPPSARRGPAFNYPSVAPVHPIAEETDSMRGSIRNASAAFDPAHSSYASSNAIPIGVPGYYLEERGSGYSHPSAVMRRPSADQSRPSLDFYDEPPLDLTYDSEREGGRDYAESPSPEPAALIRQASLGKRTKPTLTTVKSGERMGESQQRQITPPKEPVHVPRMDQMMARSRVSTSSSEDSDLARAERSGQEEKALEAASAATAAAAGTTLYTSTTKNTAISRDNLSNRTPSSDILSGGTGLLDPSSSEESEKAPKKRRSRELLGAMLGQGRSASRSRSRSPLSLIATSQAQRESVIASSERDARTPNLDALDAPSPSFAEDGARRRPLKLDIDAVRDAEARGSLTSLSDLIRRATRLASNLDRGKTASRLGMSFFEGLDSTERALAVQEANRRSGSISDILGSFPTPGLQTPQDGQFTRFSKLQHSQLPSESDVGEIRPRGRRCCGMPVWLFSVLMVFVVLLVCAAVLVPVVLLIILPGQKSS